MRHSCLSVSDMRELSKYRMYIWGNRWPRFDQLDGVFFRYSIEVVK